MLQSLISDDNRQLLDRIKFAVGNSELFEKALVCPALEPFSEQVIEFMNDVSKALRGMKEVREYPDVATLGFWIRKSSVKALQEKYYTCDGNIHLGRGLAFHIAPSNVPVNYAFSLFTGLMCGNVNIVRIPSKDFPQVRIINRAINQVLSEAAYENLREYIFLVQYDRNKDINDLLSACCDVRIIWGGDATIKEIRKSEMHARAGEVTFADRYSMAVINSDDYISAADKRRIAEDFYNDTYLTDQNACTSPRLVVWTGSGKDVARDIFWKELESLVNAKYNFQPIMGVNKLTSAYKVVAKYTGEKIKILPHKDNTIIRVEMPRLDALLMDYKDASGFFFEYMCDDILDLKDICNNTHCQTIGLLGNPEMLKPLLLCGIKGVDRVVPLGKTMDFDFIWDGYNLFERLTRTISINGNK